MTQIPERTLTKVINETSETEWKPKYGKPLYTHNISHVHTAIHSVLCVQPRGGSIRWRNEKLNRKKQHQQHTYTKQIIDPHTIVIIVICTQGSLCSCFVVPGLAIAYFSYERKYSHTTSTTTPNYGHSNTWRFISLYLERANHLNGKQRKK